VHLVLSVTVVFSGSPKEQPTGALYWVEGKRSVILVGVKASNSGGRGGEEEK